LPLSGSGDVPKLPQQGLPSQRARFVKNKKALTGNNKLTWLDVLNTACNVVYHLALEEAAMNVKLVVLAFVLAFGLGATISTALGPTTAIAKPKPPDCDGC
jgi:hypothetical protein